MNEEIVGNRIPIVFDDRIRAFEIVIDSREGKNGILKIHNGRCLDKYDFSKEAFVPRLSLGLARVYPDRFDQSGAPQLLQIELGKTPDTLEDGEMLLDDNRGILYIGIYGKIATVRII